MSYQANTRWDVWGMAREHLWDLEHSWSDDLLTADVFHDRDSGHRVQVEYYTASGRIYRVVLKRPTDVAIGLRKVRDKKQLAYWLLASPAAGRDLIERVWTGIESWYQWRKAHPREAQLWYGGIK